MDTKTAIKIGLVAGVVSAMFPSIPTIVFGHKTWGSEYDQFMQWYIPLGGLVVLGVLLW